MVHIWNWQEGSLRFIQIIKNWGTQRTFHKIVQWILNSHREEAVMTISSIFSPGGSVVKNPPAVEEIWVDLWVRKILWTCQPTPVFLLGKFHRQRSQAGYSPWVGKRVGHNWATKSQQHKLNKAFLKRNTNKTVYISISRQKCCD